MGTMGSSLNGSSVGLHQSMFPYCFSSVQSQKGTMTWSYSSPFDLWMEKMRTPLVSSLWIVFEKSVSSHSSRKALISLTFSLT